MSDPTLDLDAYCRRIGFDGPLVPTHDTLARLIERHAAAIPFENIEVLAGRVPALDPASLHRKMVGQRRGGYCYEQNHLLLACLRQAGFVAHRLEARVRAGVPQDVVTGRTHLALRVTLDGEDHLADVGFGGMAPVAPLQLARRDEQAAGSGAYRLVDSDGDLLLQIGAQQHWNDCYRIGPVEPQLIDCELGNWFVATHPKSMLRQNLLIACARGGERLTLFNRTLSRRRPETAAAEDQTLTSRAELAEVLADLFGLDIAPADFDAVMAALERQTDA